jgi:hypothetical protein
MGTANYEIVRVKDGWGIKHEGEVAGSYATKEIAFEMAALAASNAIKEGHAVTLAVPGVGASSETALGAR